MIKTLALNIWNRKFELPIEYDCYSNEKVTDAQINAVSELSNNLEIIDNSKELVEKYCKKDLSLDKDNKNKDNIFTYIIPHYIYVKRDDNPRIAIMCKYKYDMEHGIAIVIYHNGKVEIGKQDIIL